ncbi:MAG TPA: outer membrane protein assembly factor BamD [Methylomirabilota bacterium]|nr:outer membrane protein assembly factor BamD [Methylomirabilota bacterium]
MSRARRALPVLLLLAGCTASQPASRAVPPSPTTVSTIHTRPAAAARLVAYGDELAARGEAREAVLIYESVARDYPTDPAAADALHGLGRVQAGAAAPARNYRAALTAFTRLLAEYPDSRWTADARAWKSVLNELLAREEETARLRSQIEHLRRTDLELERRR